MFPSIALTLAALAGLAASTTITVVNHCSSAVDPGFFPAANNGALGGFALAAGASQAVTLPSGYSGRAWGRTGCDDAGVCTTGSCSGGVNCTAPAAAGPTLAQFTINGFSNLDFFNPGVADGFNIPVTITPGAGCSTAAVTCSNAAGAGNGCGATSTCPTGTAYTLSFC
ncbi:Osmotin thaumatin-like protein [Punctularia strigosozonata HHB-11173 SS5]|uniref:Osmotin thaumatin-like protein n=1 Tax=Punctularia strigosozonata (strain HHB-11173) TaxID=741275 RepID=UPI00044186D6|nr:Osmotin thaumatin-like protein [Punctularia strigosozonata HHB-11173 SS5]EIN09642.1 Osmotin thaumatin-like protein [Punctularia strigosozonata HHB-11173 SS5]